jgi:hypothetical protein
MSKRKNPKAPGPPKRHVVLQDGAGTHQYTLAPDALGGLHIALDGLANQGWLPVLLAYEVLKYFEVEPDARVLDEFLAHYEEDRENPATPPDLRPQVMSYLDSDYALQTFDHSTLELPNNLGWDPEEQWARNTMQGRHQIINEARMPDHYTQATGKNAGRHNIHPALCKALLQYLSLRDNPGGRQFKSNERAAHEMEMPLSTLNNCIKALVE